MTHENEIVEIDSSDESEPKNRCTLCGVDMGPQNPRQLCAKTYCMEKGYWFLQNQSDDDSDDEKTEKIESDDEKTEKIESDDEKTIVVEISDDNS